MGEAGAGAGDSPEQLTAGLVGGVVHHVLEDPTEVQGEPAQGEYQNQTEDRLGHLPALRIERTHRTPTTNTHKQHTHIQTNTYTQNKDTHTQPRTWRLVQGNKRNPLGG